MMHEVSREEIGWLAGILDGEGTIRVYHVTNRGRFGIKPDLRVANTNVDIIHHAARIMRALAGDEAVVHVYAYEPSPGMRAKKPYFHVQVGKRKAIADILTAVEPFLYGKKSIAEVVRGYCLRRLNMIPRRGGQIGSLAGGSVAPFTDKDSDYLRFLRISLDDIQTKREAKAIK